MSHMNSGSRYVRNSGVSIVTCNNEQIFRDQVERGLRLEHPTHENNTTRDTPFDIVYAHEHDKGMDDDF